MPKPILASARWRALRLISFVGGLTLASAGSAQSLSHAPDPLFHDGYEGIVAGPFNDSDASRFLAQATFGPTDADIAHLRAIGYQAWLTEQFAATPTYQVTDQPGQVAYLNWTQNTLGERIGQDNRQEAWFLGALGGPDPQNNLVIHQDQLRQRVAFALSEILVVSDNNPTLSGWPRGMAYYYDILTKNAFGNYRALLEQVTLSPAMGVYLNMMGNRRADLSQNLHPDENYGREINQLFSVGLVMLNLDGTPKSPAAATYTQSTITNFAHVLTGWNWASCDANGYDNFDGCFTPYNTESDFETPMVAYETKPPNETDTTRNYNFHDNGTHTDDTHNKQLLAYGQAGGGVLADNGTAQSDLTFALDNIFNHPNVGPFISKELIQRLVTSNPSPAYVSRVATVFNNNGSSVRGDLKAVVQAILLDPEARYGQWRSADTFGKLREPLLTLTHFWRDMNAKHMCGNDLSTPNGSNPPIVTKYSNQPYRYAGYSTAWNTNDTQYGGGVAQASLDAFTVFNFFKPGFVPSGEMTAKGLFGPEFQLQTDSIIVNSTNTTGYHAFYYDINDYYDPNGHPGVHCDPNDDFGDVKVDHAKDSALAGTTGTGGASDALVDAYSRRFMSGQMSPFMRQTLITYLNTIDNSSDGSDWRLQRIYRALYLIFNSPEYMIQK
jgi:uncharacterized protein (DUF1800 family)